MEDFKSKDIVWELIQIEAMYRSIEIAYDEYQARIAVLSPVERLRSTGIVVTPPIGFQAYITKIMTQDAEQHAGDIVLQNCGVEVKRIRGKLKTFKKNNK